MLNFLGLGSISLLNNFFAVNNCDKIESTVDHLTMVATRSETIRALFDHKLRRAGQNTEQNTIRNILVFRDLVEALNIRLEKAISCDARRRGVRAAHMNQALACPLHIAPESKQTLAQLGYSEIYASDCQVVLETLINAISSELHVEQPALRKAA